MRLSSSAWPGSPRLMFPCHTGATVVRPCLHGLPTPVHPDNIQRLDRIQSCRLCPHVMCAIAGPRRLCGGLSSCLARAKQLESRALPAGERIRSIAHCMTTSAMSTRHHPGKAARRADGSQGFFLSLQECRCGWMGLNYRTKCTSAPK